MPRWWTYHYFDYFSFAPAVVSALRFIAAIRDGLCDRDTARKRGFRTSFEYSPVRICYSRTCTIHTIQPARIPSTKHTKMSKPSPKRATPYTIHISASESPGHTHVDGLSQESADKASELLMQNHSKYHILFNDVGLHSTFPLLYRSPHPPVLT